MEERFDILRIVFSGGALRGVHDLAAEQTSYPYSLAMGINNNPLDQDFSSLGLSRDDGLIVRAAPGPHVHERSISVIDLPNKRVIGLRKDSSPNISAGRAEGSKLIGDMVVYVGLPHASYAEIGDLLSTAVTYLGQKS